MQSFLKTDTQWSAQYDEVLPWMQWPERHGHDTGIDLVARERDTLTATEAAARVDEPQRPRQRFAATMARLDPELA